MSRYIGKSLDFVSEQDIISGGVMETKLSTTHIKWIYSRNGFTYQFSPKWIFLFSLQYFGRVTVKSPTMLVRRCLCYLMSSMAEEALRDGQEALAEKREWPTAFYLQAAALKSLGMDNDAEEILNVGTSLEVKKLDISWKVNNTWFFLFGVFWCSTKGLALTIFRFVFTYIFIYFDL